MIVDLIVFARMCCMIKNHWLDGTLSFRYALECLHKEVIIKYWYLLNESFLVIKPNEVFYFLNLLFFDQVDDLVEMTKNQIYLIIHSPCYLSSFCLLNCLHMSNSSAFLSWCYQLNEHDLSYRGQFDACVKVTKAYFSHQLIFASLKCCFLFNSSVVYFEPHQVLEYFPILKLFFSKSYWRFA